jgi:hypothetical protein
MPTPTTNVKNRGIDIERQKRARNPEKDWREEPVFGAVPYPCKYAIPEAQREAWLPVGEIQRGTTEDWSDCATRSPLNALEAKFTYAYNKGLMVPENKKWLEDNGYVADGKITFSDRFTAILAHTTRDGNSLIEPIETLRTKGLIPKPMLPAAKYMNFAMYHDPESITSAMLALGKEFAARFTIQYREVKITIFSDVLDYDMFGVAGYAWPFPENNGEYPRDDRPFNHAFCIYKRPAYNIFDNYVEVGTRDDFTKKLAPDYALYEIGYRVYVASDQVPQPVSGLFEIALGWVARIITWMNGGKKGPMPEVPKEIVNNIPPAPVEPPKPVEPTNREKLFKAAKASLGKDISPGDLVNDEVGCAESVSKVIQLVYPDFPTILGTAALNTKLQNDKRFQQTDKPAQPGFIIVSPTGSGLARIAHGHTGIFGEKDRIMSNTSATGKWTDNYSLAAWISYFRTKGGLKVHYFEPLN